MKTKYSLCLFLLLSLCVRVSVLAWLCRSVHVEGWGQTWVAVLTFLPNTRSIEVCCVCSCMGLLTHRRSAGITDVCTITLSFLCSSGDLNSDLHTSAASTYPLSSLPSCSPPPTQSYFIFGNTSQTYKCSHLGYGGCWDLPAPFKCTSHKWYSGPWKGYLCLFSAWLILDLWTPCCPPGSPFPTPSPSCHAGMLLLTALGSLLNSLLFLLPPRELQFLERRH